MRTPARLFRPLGTRDFALLWGGQSISLIGDGIFTVTLAWQTLSLSSSPTALAAVLLARSIPHVLFLVVGGAVTDRLPRRSLLIASDLVRGIASGAIALLVATGAVELWHLVALGAVFGTANAFFFPAYTAIVPEVLPAELLPGGNALDTTARLVGSSFAGPAIGGVIIGAAGTRWAFGADAISYAIAVVAAMLMRARPAPPAGESRIVQEVREGFRFTRSQPWLWVTLLAAFVGNLSFSSLSLLRPILVKEELGGSAAALGAVYAAAGVGGLIAAVVAGSFGFPRRRVAVMYASWTTAAVALGVLGLAPGILLVAVANGVIGLTLEYGNIVWITLMQELVPRRMLGRVSSFDWMLSLGLSPLAFAAAGPLGAALGAGPVLVGGGIIAVVANITGVTRRGVLDPDREAPDSTPDGAGP